MEERLRIGKEVEIMYYGCYNLYDAIEKDIVSICFLLAAIKKCIESSFLP